MASAMPELQKLIASLKAVNVEAKSTKKLVEATVSSLEALAKVNIKFDTSQLEKAQTSLYLLQEYSKGARTTLDVLSQSAPFKSLSRDIEIYLNKLDLARQKIQGLAGSGQPTTFTIGEEGNVLASTEEARQKLVQLADSLETAKTSEEAFSSSTKKSSDNLRETTKTTDRATKAVKDLDTALKSREQITTKGTQIDPIAISGMDTLKVISGDAEQLNTVFKESETLSKRLKEAMDILDKEYSEAGMKLNEYKVNLDAVNKSIQIQATLSKSIPGPEGLGGESRVVGATRRVTLDIGTGEELSRLKEMQAVFKEFGAPVSTINTLNKSLKNMGLTLEDVTHKELQANDGLLRLSFSGKSAAGVTRNQTVLLNKQGEIVSSVKQKYEGLTGAISNNIVKVMNWGIAIGIVYGTFRKFQDAISEMIELESAMADIQIVTGRSTSEMGDALAQLADAAERTGLTLGQAAQGFEAALRASSGAANETERMAMAQQLLADSLVFARLANLDVTTSIDTLIGALRQSGIELDNAGDLLDKWVATSKSAKVSLQDLGESFAITAAQAKAVGLNIDELNGLIGVIAEVTTLSSTEIGNLARRMLSALESDAAVKSLQAHGIAVQDLEGNYRDWMDVINDVALAYEAGALSEKGLSEIGKDVGGGVRGGPQVVAVVKGMTEHNRIMTASANASGDAAEALDIKMDTLKGATNDLTVAFSMLAKTLGEDGGLLDFMTKSVDIFTFIIESLSKLTEMLGSSTTKVITFVAAWAAFNKLNIGARLGGMTAGLGRVGGRIPSRKQDPVQARMSMYVSRGDTQSASAGFASGVKTTLSPMMPTMGTALGFAAMEAMSGGNTASIIGSGIGAAIGSTFGPIGMLIGSQIGSTIAGKIAQANEIISKEVTEYQTSEEAETAYKKLAESQFGIDVLVSGKGATGFLDRAVQEAQKREEGDTGFLGIEGWWEANLQYGSLTKAELQKAMELQKRITELKTEEAKEAAKVTEESKKDPDAKAAYRTERAEIAEKYGPVMREALAVGQREMMSSWLKGESSRADFTRYTANIEALETQMPQIQQYAGEELGITGQRESAEMATELAKLDPAALEFLQTFLADLGTIDSEMAQLSADTSQWMQLSVLKGEKEAELAELILGILNEAKSAAENIKFDTSYTRRPKELTPDIMEMLVGKAREQQAEVALQAGTTPEVLAEQADPFMEIWGDKMVTIEGLSQQTLNDIISQYSEWAEEMKSVTDDAFHVQRLKDVSPDKFGEIQAKNRYWIEYLSRMKGMSAQEYVQEEGYTENLVMGPNNVWQKILTTSEAMNFTLQDILETEKKQLEGMWNIPEGATFWVPITSLFYQGGDGGGGVPELPPLEPLEEKPDGVFDPQKFTEEAIIATATTTKEKETLSAADRALALEQELIRADTRRSPEEEELPTSRFSEMLAAQFLPSLAGTFQEILSPIDRIIDELGAIGADPIEKQEGGWEGIFDSIQNSSNTLLQYIQSQQDRPLQINLTEGETEINLTLTTLLDGTKVSQIIQRIIAAELGRSARSQGYTGTLRS